MGKIMYKGEEFQGRIERLSGVIEMTMAEYSELTPEEIANGYFYIPDYSAVVSTDFPYIGNGIKQVQANMSIAEDSTNGTVTSVYTSGAQIGCESRYKDAIDLTDAREISFDLTLGNCYGGGAQATTQRFYYTIALLNQTNINSSGWLGGETTNLYELYKQYQYSNTTIHDSLDVSSLVGSHYLALVMHGWSATISNIKIIGGYSGKAVSTLGDIYVPLHPEEEG